VSGSLFGGSAGLLQRLRPTAIGVAELREVADTVLPGLCTARLRVRLDGRTGASSVVVVEEDERCVQTSLGELADDMTDAGVRATPAAMAAALSSWVAHRPVTDATAAATGVAVLDWADTGRTSVGWCVVVQRGPLALRWTPGSTASAAAVARIRETATDRSAEVLLDLRVEGPVALWSHAVAPSLATAALVSPESMLQRARSAGLAGRDLHVVVTPHRPVACADRAIAARLAGETPEAGVTLPWRELTDLSWL
jgi:hypothetical protein